MDFLDLSADRQGKLREHFYFDCVCKLCSQHTKDDLMMASAANSEGKQVRVLRRAGICCAPALLRRHTQYRVYPVSLMHSSPACF